MKRKYLDDINVKNRPDKWGKDDKRKDKWKEQRKTYGFDERETWSLDLTFHLWLYERLKMYLDVTVVDLDYHKFTYKEKEYTQREMIDGILKRLEFSFSKDYNDCDDKQWNYVREADEMWTLIIPAMWW